MAVDGATVPIRRGGRPGAAVLLVLVLAAALVPAAAAAERWPTWVVDAAAPLPAHARVVSSVPVADALVVAAPQAPAGAVATTAALHWRSSDLDAGFDGAAPPGAPAEDAVSWTGADLVWAAGERGERAVVALIDTGVAPVDTLDGAVAAEIDFSGSGGGDGYGHGTYLASLIAGRDAASPGVAPDAGLLSLKVADADGSTDLGTVLGALQWLHGPGRATGVQVAVLALGVDAGSPAARLLDRASDRLAGRGVLLVTAAGNDGPGELSSPATATATFSAGAVDHRDPDPVAAAFSATGVDRAGVAQPDVLAPGVRVLGAVPPDSLLAREHADVLLDGARLRGSGTSMAAALTGGVAALASSARPDLDGAGLEDALRAGDGRLDALDAVDAALDAPPGRGRWAAMRPVAAPPRTGPPPGRGPERGNVEPRSVQWRSLQWRSVQWRSVQWRSVQWRSVQWRSVQWRSVQWRSVRWRSVQWRGEHWGDASGEPARWGSVQWRAGGWAATPLSGDALHSVRWRAQEWEPFFSR